VTRHGRLDALATVILVACCVAWGLNQAAIKVSLAGIPPVLGAGLRSLVAGTLLLAWCLVRAEPPLIRDGTGRYGLLLGLIFSAEFVLLYSGLAFTTASRSVIFLYMAPFFVALGAHRYVPGERLTAARTLGLGLAFSGLCLAFADSLRLPSRRELVGDLLEVGAAALWGATTVLVKTRGYLGVSPSRTLFYQLGVSGVLLTGLGVTLGERVASQPSPRVLTAFAFQAVVVAFVSYLAWFWLLTRYSASGLAAFSFLTPLFGVLAGALLLGERLTGYLGAAAALVAIGIVLVNRSAPP
jgi:drug/metabolite transporter (DMT)-like permease